jgi:hypothetical protein
MAWIQGEDFVDAQEALRFIRSCAQAGDIVITRHGRERMRERQAQLGDILCVLLSPTSCLADHDKWKVKGFDLDDDPLTCIVALEDKVIVVTIF